MSFADFLQQRDGPRADEVRLDLRGIALGNAWIDPYHQYDVSRYAHARGLITEGQVHSLRHAEATFVGGRVGLSELQNLATGMMQRGDSRHLDRWGAPWQSSLPRFGADDFTMWWLNAQTTAYGTSQSSGPYLFDPATYAPQAPASVLQIAEKGYNDLVAEAKRVQQEAATWAFQPSWLYPPQEAAKDYTTLTSGTYI